MLTRIMAEGFIEQTETLLKFGLIKLKEHTVMESIWKETNKADIRTFCAADGEPEVIHIIKTCFVDRYFVVYEDAYGICNDMKVESYSSKEIKEKFSIDLS